MDLIEDSYVRWRESRSLNTNDRTATYVSMPITTGVRYFEWLTKTTAIQGTPEFANERASEVLVPNITSGTKVVDILSFKGISPIINPAGFENKDWKQAHYHEFWARVISDHVSQIVFVDGWELSQGCVKEFVQAKETNIRCLNQQLGTISIDEGIAAISQQIVELDVESTIVDTIKKEIEKLERLVCNERRKIRRLYKDEILDEVAAISNVAQFVSIEPGEDLRRRFSRICGSPENEKFSSIEDAVGELLANSPSKKINIRTYDPHEPEGNPFIMGIDTVEEALRELRYHASDKNLYTILNEYIDKSDGGVSGVCWGDTIEFAPDATPRCVDDETIDTALLPKSLGVSLLKTVYGEQVKELEKFEDYRVEFSVHPSPQGYEAKQVIIWQTERKKGKAWDEEISWPNQFSRFLGDKAFGLLVGSAAGLQVPKTLVFHNRVFPFQFGRPTGTNQFVTRPCPETKYPGFYETKRGWFDPFVALKDWRVLAPKEFLALVKDGAEPDIRLASILIQESVNAVYSGVAEGTDISGRKGSGDAFMVGEEDADALPDTVRSHVAETLWHANSIFSDVRIEWVFDGNKTWIVQLNRKKAGSQNNSYPQDVIWEEFSYRRSRLEEFRMFVKSAKKKGVGVVVVGNVSSLSHVGEIVDDAGIPYRFEKP